MRVLFSRPIGQSTECNADTNTRIVIGDRGVYIKRPGHKAFVVPFAGVLCIEPHGDDGQKDEVPDWLWAPKSQPQATPLVPAHGPRRP